jgi:hypothetical protein
MNNEDSNLIALFAAPVLPAVYTRYATAQPLTKHGALLCNLSIIVTEAVTVALTTTKAMQQRTPCKASNGIKAKGNAN